MKISSCSVVRKTERAFLGVAILVALTLFGPALPVPAQSTLSVTNLADNGPGSLRQAITDAPAGATILFATNGIITLTSGELAVGKNLNIVGPGAPALAISGNYNSRVFNVASGVSLSLSGLTLRDGRSASGSVGGPGLPGGAAAPGGGVYNAGNLTLSDCVLTNNRAGTGGIGGNGGTGGLGGYGGNGGHGGAIYHLSSGSLALHRCTLVGNASGSGGAGGNGGAGAAGTFFGDDGRSGAAGGAAGSGGGIYSAGIMTFSLCTFSGNQAGSGGAGGRGGNGGIGLFDDGTGGSGGNGGWGGFGGGIWNANSLFVISATIASNSAGAGGVAGPPGSGEGNYGFGSSGVPGMGGGLNQSGGTPAELVNTIVALNTSPSGSAHDVAGAVVSSGHNLVGSTPGSAGFGSWGDVLNLNPVLGPLTNNGGATPTHAPLPGSPVIDAGDNGYAPATDQRGLPRIMGRHLEIGAVEFEGLVPGATTRPETQLALVSPNVNATLNGTVNPNGLETRAWFEWGTNLSYGQLTAPVDVGSGPLARPVSNSFANLTPFVNYHYRVVGSNSLGVAYGTDHSFGMWPVSNLVDSGAGSLREALANAGSGMTILLTNTGTLMLTNGELLLSKDLDLVGPGATNLVVSGNNSSRVFRVSGGSTVNISGLTIMAGHAPDATGTGQPGQNGGGIYNSGTLTLSDCALSSNRAGTGGPGGTGGAGGAGGHGGGICNDPTGVLTLNRCTVSGNSSGRGGNGGPGPTGSGGLWAGDGGTGGTGGAGGLGAGTYSLGSATFVLCTVSGNTNAAGGNGGPGGHGGIGTFDDGAGGRGGAGGGGGTCGAVFNANSLWVRSCTIVNNSAGIGGAGGAGGAGEGTYGPGPAGGSGTVGGIYNNVAPELAHIVNTIVALNIYPASNADDVRGGFSSGGHNLIGTTNGSTGFSASGDQVNNTPLLGSLANNGGSTLTHTPLSGSPVVNAGDNSNAPETDQRGQARVMGGAIDIGAVEFQGAPVITTLASSQVQTVGTNGSAMLNATVNSYGVATRWWFEYGLSTNYGHATITSDGGGDSVAVTRSNGISNLAPGLVYYYRAVASNSLGMAFGADLQFAPLLILLNGNNPFFLPEDGNYTEPGFTVIDPITSNSTTWVTGLVNSSAPGIYPLSYYASNVLGATASTTRAVVVVAAPSVTTLPPSSVLSTEASAGATLNGTVNPNGSATMVWFEWGPGASYGQRVAVVAAGSGSVPQPFTHGLTNLTAGMTYHYRLVASNSVGGVVHGADELIPTLRLVLNGVAALTNQCHLPFADPGTEVRAAPLILAAGYRHNLALQADGTVFGWGDSTFAQTNGPEQATNVIAVGAGGAHSLALRADGTILGWGAGTNNTGVFPNYGQAMIPPTATNVSSLAAGYWHSLALQADGTVIGWGAGTDNTRVNQAYGQAAVPATATNVMALAAGGLHSLALTSGGQVLAWGAGTNTSGTNEHFGQALVPAAATNVIAIAAGYWHSLALKANGTIVAWGDSSFGQTAIPTSATNVVAIAAGYLHSLALQADGTVLVWGDTSKGQGDIPASATNVVAIAAGGDHNLALRADGTLVAWGDDSYGQATIPVNLDWLDLLVSVDHTVNVDVPGLYVLTYSVTNAAGSVARSTRTVAVPFVGPISGFVFDGAAGLPGITVSAMREWQPYPAEVITLPDLSTNGFPIPVAGTNAIGAVEVQVDITHSFRGDLELTLIHVYDAAPGVTNRTEVRLKHASIDEDFEDLNTTYSSLIESGVTGRLTDFYGQPMRGTWTLRVRDAYPGDTGILQRWQLHLGVTNVTTTGDGSFRFTGLDTIPWYVIQPLWSGYGFDPAAYHYVTVGTTNLVFHLLNAPISGRILSGGIGLADVTVTATSAAGQWSVRSDAAGNYQLAALAPGSYRVAPELAGHTFTPGYADVNARATNVNFNVATYSITGRITNRLGFGAGGIVVTRGPANATTDLDGFYHLVGVPSGTWTVTPVAARTVFAPTATNVPVGPARTGVNFGIVSSPPTISEIASRVIPANTNTGPIRFTVADGEIPAGFLKVTAVSSNPDLVPNTATNLTFEGAGGERVVIITPASNALGTATITLTVSDSSLVEGGPLLSTSTSFDLRVNARPLAGVGSALVLNGSSDAVRVNTNVISFKGSFTLEAWVYAASNAVAGGARTLLSQGSGANMFALGFNAQGRIRLGTNWVTAVPFPLGAWHHLAVVRDTTNTQLYVDGILKTNLGAALLHPPQTADFTIGARPGGGSEFWLGRVDEVRVWQRALSAAELQQGTNRIVLSTETGLAGLWRFDEPVHARTNAVDSSRVPQHGRLVGQPLWAPAGVGFDHYITPEENEFLDHLPAFDFDGDPLTYRIINPGEKGDAVLLLTGPDSYAVITNTTTGEAVTNFSTGEFAYTPKPNINGADRFSFLVSDGFEESDLAVITVNIQPDTNAPFLTAIPDQLTAEEQPLQIVFEVGDQETAASDLVLWAESSDPALVPDQNIVFGGAGTNRTVTLTPATNQFGTNLIITLFVNDGQFTFSREFRLTVTNVNDAPVISGLPANVFVARNTNATVAFTVGDVDHSPGSLVVGAWTEHPAIAAVIATNGAGATRTLTLQSSAGSAVTTVTLLLSDGLATTTNQFTVTVNNAPVLNLVGGGVRKTFANQPGTPIAFTVGDTETPFPTLVDTNFNPGPEGEVYALALQTNGQILVGGWFNTLGGQSRTHLGRLNPDGTLDTNFLATANAEVYAIALQTNGQILVGGYFSLLGGQARNRIARLNADGTVDATFNPGCDGVVLALQVQPNGQILVGGWFQTLGGQPRSCLGRLNADGSLDPTFNPGANSDVYALALQPDGRIVVGGWFNTLGGQPQSYLGRLNSDGTLDTSFTASANNGVFVLAVQTNGQILVGGYFSLLGGQSRSRLGRLHSDGSVDAGFNPGANSEVWALALPPGGKVLAGGYFSTLGGQRRKGIGQLHADGTLDDEFNPGTDGSVRALAVQPNGQIVVGGYFNTLGNQPRRSLGRLNPAVSSGLQLAATASDPALISQISFGGDGANRTLVITPARNQVGTVTITLTVTDGDGNRVTTNFVYTVTPLPPYEVIDLGALGQNYSYAQAINDSGQVVGYSYDANWYSRAFLWETNVMRNLGALGGASSDSFAYGINERGQVVGYSYSSSYNRAFLWETNVMRDLGAFGGASSHSYARGINKRGQVVGYAVTNGYNRAFLWESNVLRDLGAFGGASSHSYAYGINERGQVVGYAYSNNYPHAALWETNAGAMRDLGSLGGAYSYAYGVNEPGQVVGSVRMVDGYNRAALWESNQMTDLGTLGGYESQAFAINNNGQAVGWATTLNDTYVAAAFLDGIALNLNTYVSADSDWSSLREARAINNLGGIVGYGYLKSGYPHAFLLQPKWIIGEPVPIPYGAINPKTGKPYRTPEFTPTDAFAWGEAEGKLYSIRPTLCQVKWYDTADIMTGTGTNATPVLPRFTVAAVCVWPEYPQIHVAGAPAQVEPPQVGVSCRYVNLEHTTSAAVVDLGAKTFSATSPGYSVLRYLRDVPAGVTPDPASYTNLFQVVRTVAWSDTKYLVADQPAVVGVKLTDPATQLPPSVRSGYVLHTNAYYDSVAYDRDTQTGPILPVNANDKLGVQDDLVVAFYHTNQLTGVEWPDEPVRFKVSWPTNADPIVIASGAGSGLLDPLQYRDLQIYNQPDVALPGFNPNEEHALLAPTQSGTGQALFALRNDLNAAWGMSANFVLLKYRPAETNEWHIKVFEVVAEAGIHRFQYSAEAGREIQPPYPLGVLPVCPDKNIVVSGRAHRDYAGRIYARAADTPDTADPKIVIRYFYPLLPDFYYHTNAEPTVRPGDCIAWLDHRASGLLAAPNHTSGTHDTPIDVTYQVSWPTNLPTLQLGETLLTAKGALPNIKNMASAELVFDTLNPDGANPTNAAVRMFDPLSARTLRLTNVAGVSASYQFPSGVRRENVNGREVFTDLPYVLRSRLSYDPLNRTLSFKGVLDESGVGEPLLLLNVMSPRERDRLKQLSAEPRFQSIVDALYKLTRNPNQVDLAGTARKQADLVPADALLIGFINQFTFTVRTNANVQVNYLKAGTPEISIPELRRLEATNAVNAGSPNVTVLVRAPRPDAPTNFTHVAVTLESFGDLPKALTAGLPLPAGGVRYLTVVENDNANLSGLPVGLKLIALTNRLFQGDVKIIYPDNVFDEKLTLRHSLDFAGAPENAEFEWYTHPDLSSFVPTDLPTVNASGSLADAKGWTLFNFSARQGVNDITLGDGGQASLFTLQDNWFVLRYRYLSGGQTNWSGWVGDPASGATPRAILAEGWIKRVIKGINPYEARVKDFHSAATATYASMLIQAGQRYEGDIALNPNPDNLNQIGLIETYETILRRGKSLSIDGVPAVTSDPANNALLLAASRISDLYMLLGNEAFADAGDPLVMFTTDSGAYGTLAPSIFCFQNQLDSLLEEELGLLRGRDESAAGVGAKPIYNRLFWNFTTGEGEVAYAQTYNITDQNLDGTIDEYDARILFPQGHGDAWGHYLTATTTYYDLLRHPRYIWVPRAESILVAGASVSVDFLDERKFASAAAAKARTGVQLVDLTYRSRYVDDPAGQWQGYKEKEADADRAWGMTEWARRAGQGAYFDWLTANAILPAQDPNPNHAGIQKIDRTTVAELAALSAQYHELQSQMDQADAGLNPLGLARNVVPFDIDPVQVEQQGRTHFEQISDRAVKMMNNAVLAWNEVNQLNEALRRNQDGVQEFTGNANDQERDYKDRLIEIFGYPYAGDIGAGQTYPSGYDGPDLYHYMYVNTTELNGDTAPPSQTFTGYYKRIQGLNTSTGQGEFFFPQDFPTTADPRYSGGILEVNYPYAAADYGFRAPAAWGARRAAGEIQMALSDLVQADAALKQTQLNYDNLMQDLDDAVNLLQARYNLEAKSIQILDRDRNKTRDLDAGIAAAKTGQKGLEIFRDRSQETADAIADGAPKAVGLALDPSFPARLAVKLGGAWAGFTLGTLETLAEGAVGGLETEKNKLERATSISIQKEEFKYEIQQQLQQVEAQLREEAVRRVEVFSEGQKLEQAVMRYTAAVTKGERLIQERIAFRKNAAAETQTSRYKDMAFRIFRNDALQKYRAQFDLAARYVYLAATAYDYEVNLLGSANGSGRQFLTDIVRQRSLGQMRDGVPVVGVRGLADPLARLNANFDVLKGQMGFLTPEIETGRFSLRSEMFRVRPHATNGVGTVLNPDSQKLWRDALQNCQVANLWDVPEFRRYCRSFAPESAGPQPGLVIRFPTTVTFGLNFFGWPLSGGDSAYDSSRFATKIRSVGVWFNDYDGLGLSATPRVYLVPVGADVLRTPTANDFTTREWKVVDQAIPEPYPLGPSQFQDPAWIPLNDSLSDSMIAIRRFASFRAYHDAGWDPQQLTADSRLIGRSVWNTDWLLIIPGGTFLNNPDDGLERFISSVSDIKLFFQTYSYPGN